MAATPPHPSPSSPSTAVATASNTTHHHHSRHSTAAVYTTPRHLHPITSLPPAVSTTIG
nr:hypothetical protein [Tanacetum cinerariifolium]